MAEAPAVMRVQEQLGWHQRLELSRGRVHAGPAGGTVALTKGNVLPTREEADGG